jgi:aspartyl-tRNA(Asn)/glutamyl-tRNA(Gln) amidotransferase subunit A
MTALHELGAVEALALFRTRELSPVELMAAVIARADALEPDVNALPFRYDEESLALARAAEARYAAGGDPARPLDGLPVAVKEETAVAGRPNTFGSLTAADNVATETAPYLQRVIDAGGILHAQTATPEFSCAPNTTSRLWGPTRNPWDLAASVGGSSGGSAAALAAGMAPLATGSDIGGSIRVPSACCGTVGFKPPPGRVPEVPPFNRDYYCHEGPMARSVADVRLLQNVIAGPHFTDVASLRPKLEIPAELGDVRGWKVALSVTLGDFDVHPEVAANTRAVGDALRAAGADVVEVELSWTHRRIAQAALAHLGSIFGMSVGVLLEQQGDLLSDYAADFGRRAFALEPGALLEGMTIEGELYPELGRILDDHRALICPTLAVLPWAADASLHLESAAAQVMTLPFNMFSACPVMAVPSGRAADGLPTGVQVVGPTFDDVSVFHVAAAIERERPWTRLAPDQGQDQ